MSSSHSLRDKDAATSGLRSQRPAASRRRVVLVVDDQESIRTYLNRVLTAREYEVRTAVDGEAALKEVADRCPDIVLLDVQMPGIDGFEVCRRLKSDPVTRLVPVVLVTGLDAQRQRLEGINAGADDFLSKPFHLEELQARIRSLLLLKSYTDDLESAESVILSLALTVEARDPYTGGHCERLARYASALGRELHLPEDDIAALQRGGYLHDVGKIGIPDAVLQKPSQLTEAETELMKRHPLIGEQLCGALRSLASVRPIVRHHHERLDGSGYPDGLSGDRIPLLAQIVSIADVYDALTTERPYHSACPPEHAHQELRSEVANGTRRKDLVDAFLAVTRDGGCADNARRDRLVELFPSFVHPHQ